MVVPFSQSVAGVRRIRKTVRMPVFDHLGITVADTARAREQFSPVMAALGFTRHDDGDVAMWFREGEPELILYPPRDTQS